MEAQLAIHKNRLMKTTVSQQKIHFLEAAFSVPRPLPSHGYTWLALYFKFLQQASKLHQRAFSFPLPLLVPSKNCVCRLHCYMVPTNVETKPTPLDSTLTDRVNIFEQTHPLPDHCYQLAMPNIPNQKNLLSLLKLSSSQISSIEHPHSSAQLPQVNLSSTAGRFSVLMDCEPGRGDNGSTCKPGKIVAFTAKLNICDSYPAHDGVLKFANVLVNKGEAYSPGTGIFTCPLAGFYNFTVHVSTYGRAQCAIFKNGQSVVSMYHTTLPDKCSQMASISSVLQLDEDDKVWVKLWGPSRHDIFASVDNDTVFVGFHLG